MGFVYINVYINRLVRETKKKKVRTDCGVVKLCESLRLFGFFLVGIFHFSKSVWMTRKEKKRK